MNVPVLPVSLTPVRVTVMVRVPDWVTVTLSVRTPATNAEEIVGETLPESIAMPTVPVNEVTVLLLRSCAVIERLNGVPAFCVPGFATPNSRRHTPLLRRRSRLSISSNGIRLPRRPSRAR